VAVADRAESPAGPDRWAVRHPYSAWPNWLYPALVVLFLGGFGVYTIFVVLFDRRGFADPYLSPIYSPRIWETGPIPPAIWVVWAPLAFRATCYYYRKAYWRSFFWHPRSCAVPEHENGRYKGETSFPMVLNNLHRFAFYAIVLQVLFLYFDAVMAFIFKGRFGIGLGSLLMLLNIVLLSGYTFGCHALRHLSGGGLDCYSCSRTNRTRLKLWKGVTILNVRHDLWAWGSLFSVWAVDLYIRLQIHGVIGDPRVVL
jgi:hypothetical protein